MCDPSYVEDTKKLIAALVGFLTVKKENIFTHAAAALFDRELLTTPEALRSIIRQANSVQMTNLLDHGLLTIIVNLFDQPENWYCYWTTVDLTNILIATFEGRDPDHPHPVYDRLEQQQGVRTILNLLERPRKDRTPRHNATIALCLLHKGKRLPGEWSTAKEDIMSILDKGELPEQITLCTALAFLAHVPGFPSLLVSHLRDWALLCLLSCLENQSRLGQIELLTALQVLASDGDRDLKQIVLVTLAEVHRSDDPAVRDRVDTAVGAIYRHEPPMTQFCEEAAPLAEPVETTATDEQRRIGLLQWQLHLTLSAVQSARSDFRDADEASRGTPAQAVLGEMRMQVEVRGRADNVTDVVTLLGDLRVILRDDPLAASREDAWRIIEYVLENATGSPAVALEYGLATLILQNLRETPLSLFRPCHAAALAALSRHATSHGIDALLATDAVHVAVRLIHHANPDCALHAVDFLSQLLQRSAKSLDERECHPHFTTFLTAGADRALADILEKEVNPFLKSRAATSRGYL
jgi:hypothetical protein